MHDGYVATRLRLAVTVALTGRHTQHDVRSRCGAAPMQRSAHPSSAISDEEIANSCSRLLC